MNPPKVRWTFVLLLEDKSMEAIYREGPMPKEEVEKLIGGTAWYVETEDRCVLAVLAEPTPADSKNEHYPMFYGKILLGKFLNNEFVGAMGVSLW